MSQLAPSVPVDNFGRISLYMSFVNVTTYVGERTCTALLSGVGAFVMAAII